MLDRSLSVCLSGAFCGLVCKDTLRCVRKEVGAIPALLSSAIGLYACVRSGVCAYVCACVRVCTCVSACLLLLVCCVHSCLR